MTEELRDACAAALHVLTPDGRTLVGERALLHVYEGLGYRAVAVARLPPLSWLAGPAYRLVATNRRWFARWFFRPTA